MGRTWGPKSDHRKQRKNWTLRPASILKNKHSYGEGDFEYPSWGGRGVNAENLPSLLSGCFLLRLLMCCLFGLGLTAVLSVLFLSCFPSVDLHKCTWNITLQFKWKNYCKTGKHNVLQFSLVLLAGRFREIAQWQNGKINAVQLIKGTKVARMLLPCFQGKKVWTFERIKVSLKSTFSWWEQIPAYCV